MVFDPIKTQVYINCGGKSGSKTLEKSLSQYYKCIHTHGNYYFQKYIIKSKEYTLYQAIKESMKHYDNVYVIDSYRTPIERAISSCFQNNPNITLDAFNYNLLIGENYSCIEETLYEFGLPPLKKFDYEKKYVLIKHQNLNIIKIRLSDINEWSNILENVFNHPITVLPDNLSENKKYYDNYKLFLNKIKIPKLYFDCLISSNEFNIFNNKEEKNNYVNLWKNHVINKKVLIENLPDDFDWNTYVSINKGRLEQMNELEVCIHYAQTGRFEGKKYK
jgi:hypothetical protein